MRTQHRQRCRDDGQILPLILIYVMIALSLVIAIVDITAVHIQRSRLYGLADGAALNAANAVDAPEFYRAGGLALSEGDRPLPLSDRTVRSSLRDYLPRAVAAARLAQVRIGDPTGSPAPGTAEVTLAARARLPIFGVIVQAWWDGVPLRVTVRAQARRAS